MRASKYGLAYVSLLYKSEYSAASDSVLLKRATKALCLSTYR